MDDDTEDNVVSFGKTREERAAANGNEDDPNTFPVDSYVVVDVDGFEWYAEGFLVFTPDHVAIMKPGVKMAVPALVIPISRVKAALLDDEDHDV
jgi:hypothetical protein